MFLYWPSPLLLLPNLLIVVLQGTSSDSRKLPLRRKQSWRLFLETMPPILERVEGMLPLFNEGSMIHLWKFPYVPDLTMKRYVFEKQILKILLLLGSRLAICIKLQEVQWGPNISSMALEVYLYLCYLMWDRWWHGFLYSKKSMKVHSRDVPKEILQRGPFPSCNIRTSDVEQPEGFEIHEQESHVCMLKKALYSLKQAPWAWYERINSYLMKLRFTRSEVDPNICLKVVNDRPLILAYYEDNLLLTGIDPLICKSKRELDSRFGMVSYKLVTTSMEPNFKKLWGIVVGLIWEMLMNFINSY